MDDLCDVQRTKRVSLCECLTSKNDFQNMINKFWLDLKNAFGSVPHVTMWRMLERLNVPSHFVAICKEIYVNSSQRIRCKEGFTSDIPVMQGIKQGCPLSPLLFNLVLEGVLPELEKEEGGYSFQNGSCVKVLTTFAFLARQRRTSKENWIKSTSSFSGLVCH